MLTHNRAAYVRQRNRPYKSNILWQLYPMRSYSASRPQMTILCHHAHNLSCRLMRFGAQSFWKDWCHSALWHAQDLVHFEIAASRLSNLVCFNRPKYSAHKDAGSNVAQCSLHDCQPQAQRQSVAKVECRLFHQHIQVSAHSSKYQALSFMDRRAQTHTTHALDANDIMPETAALFLCFIECKN